VDTNGGSGACGRGSPLRPNLGRMRGEEVWYRGKAGQARWHGEYQVTVGSAARGKIDWEWVLGAHI
jgi:hypothetical protein